MLKKFNPITPSQRHTILLQSLPEIKVHLKKGFKRSFGRNNQGKITSKHRGGGHKRLFRHIEFKRENLSGEVINIEYDPNRSANIALIKNKYNNKFYYILAPLDLKKNNFIESGINASLNIGNALPLKYIPVGSTLHNISLKPGKKGQLIRSAGTSAQLLQKGYTNFVKIRLNSGEQRLIHQNCYATLGIVSNITYKNRKIGKAGRNRWLNRRPHVRGVAMNPIDHPHGGGEGKTSGGRPSVTFKGIITKGKPTVKKKNNHIIVKKK